MGRHVALYPILLVSQCLLITSIIDTDYDHDSKKVVCPPGCNPMACRMGILTCSESGLHELPKFLSPKTIKILFINQDFTKSRFISSSNFTYYRPPEHNITKITIQNCSLSEIKSVTFARLTHLETLDLSFNKLKEIKDHTFAGLRLKFLRLDGNKLLKLYPFSFQDLQVSSMSLVECELNNLSYNVFEKVSASLKRLMLSKNRLQTLEAKFESFFHRLEQFNLEDNRFDCSRCSLFWMIDSMKYNVARKPDMQKLLFPQCFEPFRLKGRFIHELGPSDIECPKPSVHRISILILPNNSASLTCTASDLQSQVVWTNVFTSNKSKPFNKNKNVLLSEAIHSNHLLIDQTRPVDVFSCVVTSPLGNKSSTKLQISWPKLKNRPSPGDSGPPVLHTNKVTPISNEPRPSSDFFQPQFSLIEMIAGVVGTFIGTLIVFIAMLRCIFYRMKIFTKTSQLRDHQLSLTGSKKDQRKHYMTSEPPIYSESLTYDIPSLSPKFTQSSLGHFIDFKTQQTLYDRNNE